MRRLSLIEVALRKIFDKFPKRKPEQIPVKGLFRLILFFAGIIFMELETDEFDQFLLLIRVQFPE